jgi:hypothetical protein
VMMVGQPPKGDRPILLRLRQSIFDESDHRTAPMNVEGGFEDTMVILNC